MGPAASTAHNSSTPPPPGPPRVDKPAGPPISAPLLSLVQHTELNKAGWWERTTQRLIVTSLWLQGGQASEEQILGDLRTRCKIQTTNRVKDQFDGLIKNDTLLKLAYGHYRLTETARTKYEQELHEAEGVQKAARGNFTTLLQAAQTTLDPETTWQRFLTGFLEPAVKEFGAHLYRFLSQSEPLIPQVRVDQFVKSFPPQDQAALHSVLRAFLQPKDSATRAFILRSLNAYFFLEATNLSREVIASLTRDTKTNPVFDLFVDTNFLLYLVGLRDDEYNAVPPLLDLIDKIKNYVRVRLHILPITIDETKRVISAAQASLTSVRVTKTLAEAAKRAGIDGIAEKFLTEAQRSSLNAESYFGPYLRDLIEIIRSRGAEFHNTRMEQYKKDQGVIDDLMHQQQFEKEHYGTKAKGYEQLEHDVSLWHFVQRRRPARIESPLEAGAFVLTLDYRLINFDANKTKRSGNKIPICLHPATLLQLLQFWAPRTPEFESAVFGSLGLPFFQNFDLDSERITVRILATLGRFEDINLLPRHAATKILVNSALRQKLTPDLPEEAQVALVKEAFVKELHETTAQRDTIATENQALQATATAQKTTIDDQAVILARFREQQAADEAQKTTLREQLDAEREQTLALTKQYEGTNQELLNRLTKLEQQHATRAARTKYAVHYLIPAVITTIGVPLLTGAMHWKLPALPDYRTAALTGFITLLAWMIILQRVGTHDPIIAATATFRRFHAFKNWLFTVLGALIVGILGNGMYDALKQQIAK